LPESGICASLSEGKNSGPLPWVYVRWGVREKTREKNFYLDSL
jgi:hypothetical protein